MKKTYFCSGNKDISSSISILISSCVGGVLGLAGDLDLPMGVFALVGGVWSCSALLPSRLSGGFSNGAENEDFLKIDLGILYCLY